MKYRSRTRIVPHILEATNGGVTKINIMYKTDLSYAQSKEYPSVLFANGLIGFEKGTRTYKTPSKGIHFLKTFSQIGGVIAPHMGEK